MVRLGCEAFHCILKSGPITGIRLDKSTYHRERVCSAFVDLNRDFPDPMLLGYNNLSATGSEQPETLAMMKWIKGRHFVASASMHEVRLASRIFFHIHIL